MLQKINPSETAEWKALSDHFEKAKHLHMKNLFEANPKRFEEFSQRFNDILLDYSKNMITEETMKRLQDLANACHVKESIASMFNGEAINETEDRAVLHTALRNKSDRAILVMGKT